MLIDFAVTKISYIFAVEKNKRKRKVMIIEDYVSYEIAKLLKEKGFNGQYHMYYIEDGIYELPLN